MTQATFTQLLFDIVTAILLFLWYFPFRWLMSAEVHPLKVNLLLQATYSFERSVKVVFAIAGTITPLAFFFYLQQYLLPKFIVAGHVGIWIATAPMLVIALYYQMHLLHSLTSRMEQAVRIDNHLVLQDLQTRCADILALEKQNQSLRNSQINLAKEADDAIAAYKAENDRLKNLINSLQEKLKTRGERNASDAFSDEQLADAGLRYYTDRSDAQYYVRITDLVEEGLLLYKGVPVSKAHQKRYLTRQAASWIKQEKPGAPLFAQVVALLRNGYETTAKPLAKTLLYRCETDSGEFMPLMPQTLENNGVSHLRTFAPLRKPIEIPTDTHYKTVG